MSEKSFYRFLAASALLIGGALGFIFGLTTADTDAGASRVEFGTATSEECPTDATMCQEIHQWKRADEASDLKPNAKNRESDALDSIRL